MEEPSTKLQMATRRSPWPILHGKPVLKLSSYQVANATKAAGFDIKIPVELSLVDQKGKAIQEKVKYTVSVQPARTVIRSPF